MSERRKRRGDGGFTLVEVLVALVVLAVGMLGIAAMLVDSLRSTRDALRRTEAIALAADLAERIRANRGAGAAYVLPAGRTLAAAAKPCTAVGDCNAADVAAADLYGWQHSVLSTLPGARTAITVAAAGESGGQRYTITVTWLQSGDGATAAFTLTVQA